MWEEEGDEHLPLLHDDYFILQVRLNISNKEF